jgi:spore germination cell wall hydrolase CwlJ-like protein
MSVYSSRPFEGEDLTVLLHTVIGEAEAESEKGQRAICWVIYNRAISNKFDQNTIKGICQAPWQFECWNPGKSC